MNISITKIKILLLFIISALPGCCLLIGSTKLRLSLLVTLSFLIVYSTICHKQFINEIVGTFRNKSGRILLLWLIWNFITGIIAVIYQNYNIWQFLYYFVFHCILLVCIWYYLEFTIIQKASVYYIIKCYVII